MIDHDELAEQGRQYLHASTSGRWDEAARFVADGARFVFPSGEFHGVEEMRDGLTRRYTGLSKHVDTTDVAPGDDHLVIVVAGTLAGTNLHGVPFEGVRFIDRLVLRDGLVVEQHVYNDLDSSGVLDRRA